MVDTYNSNLFKKARQLLLIVKAEIDKSSIDKILVWGNVEEAEILVSLMKGDGYNVYNTPLKKEKTFDVVILLENIEEDVLIGLIGKKACVIDAAKYEKNHEDCYAPLCYRKIRVISLGE